MDYLKFKDKYLIVKNNNNSMVVDEKGFNELVKRENDGYDIFED